MLLCKYFYPKFSCDLNLSNLPRPLIDTSLALLAQKVTLYAEFFSHLPIFLEERRIRINSFGQMDGWLCGLCVIVLVFQCGGIKWFSWFGTRERILSVSQYFRKKLALQPFVSIFMASTYPSIPSYVDILTHSKKHLKVKFY